MKKIVLLIISLILMSSIYYIYNNSNQEDILIESKLEEDFISYTLNGSSTDISYEELTSDYMVNSITCENGSVAEWNEIDKSIKLSSINIPDYCVIDFKEIPKPTLAEAILRDNPIVSERTDFSVTNTSNTTGTIYKTNKTEDGSVVYYYSGNTTNNWVYFGGFYWRIIRTNEDGSVRLLYAGTSHDTTSGYISESAFNSSYNQSRYVGYMYGGTSSLADNRNNTTSSTIKTYIDNWYKNNLLTNYDKYISKNAIYCNDRSVSSGTWVNTGTSFYFGAYSRLSSKKPSYKCGGNTSGGLFESTQATQDKFSASTTAGGNGQLAYPVALMTADEVSFAGGVYSINSSTALSSPYAYYYTNSAGSSITGSTYWWLLSPEYWFLRGNSYGFFVYSSGIPGRYSNIDVSYSYGVRPVISIDPCVKVTGTGTPTDPYQIDTVNSMC